MLMHEFIPDVIAVVGGGGTMRPARAIGMSIVDEKRFVHEEFPSALRLQCGRYEGVGPLLLLMLPLLVGVLLGGLRLRRRPGGAFKDWRRRPKNADGALLGLDESE